MLDINIWRLSLVKDESLFQKYSFQRPEHVTEVARKLMEDEPEEHLWMFALNSKLEMVGIHEVSHGTINSSICEPKDVFKRALLNNASGIIVAHNHPSGDETPSGEDVAIANRLRECGNMLGVEMLDSIVIGESGYYSLRENNWR